MRCDSCRWWRKDEAVGVFITENSWASRYAAVGECALAGSDNGRPDHPTTLAMASDAEGYAARLMTTADFGCVQWAARPEGA